MMGSRRPSPATRAAIDGCSSSPPLRMTRDNDGNPSAAWALTTASTTSERSPGVMTAMPSRSRSSTCSAVIPATSTPITSRSSSSSSPLIRRPVHRALQIGHRRRHQQRLLGQHVGLRARIAAAPRRPRPAVTGRTGWRPRPRCAHAGRRARPDTARRRARPRSGVRPLARTASTHRRAEVDRDARVDAQLGGAGDVGVVAADDHHRVALVGDARGSGRRSRRSRRRGRRAAADSSRRRTARRAGRRWHGPAAVPGCSRGPRPAA